MWRFDDALIDPNIVKSIIEVYKSILQRLKPDKDMAELVRKIIGLASMGNIKLADDPPGGEELAAKEIATLIEE
jgi:hypothetical protein